MSAPNAFYAENPTRNFTFFLISLQPVAIGTITAPSNQDECAIAIGRYAGNYNQGECAIGIGEYAGHSNQSSMGVALGSYAGATDQGYSAVAIGTDAGANNQGSYAIAIGYQAGFTNQEEKSIILNASGAALNANQSGFFVNPVRGSITSSNVLYYTANKEIVYGPVPVPGNNYSDVVNLRMSLSSTSSTNEDLNIQTATTLYLHKWNSELPEIALWDGTLSRWVIRVASVDAKAFTIGTIGASASNTNYDIFAYWNGSDVDLVADVTTATLPTQNGVYVRSGFPAQRYIGMLRTTGVAGQSAMYNAKVQPYSNSAKSAKCFCVNYYNTIERGFAYWFGSGGGIWANTIGGPIRPQLETDVDGFNGNEERGRIDFVQARPVPNAMSIQYDIYSNNTASGVGSAYITFAIDNDVTTINTTTAGWGTTPEMNGFNRVTSGFSEFNWESGSYVNNLRANHTIFYMYEAQDGNNAINEHPSHGIVARLQT